MLFFIFFKNAGDIQNEINRITNKAYENKVTVQPFLIIEGPTLLAINTSYLVFSHELRYQFKSVCEAFNLLFKTYHALHIKYPVQSQHIFQLIQTSVYKISTPYDITFPDLVDVQNMFK